MVDRDLPAAPTRVYVHNTVGRGAARHFERFRSGAAADQSPYGFHRARALGLAVELSEDSPSRVLRFLSRVSVRLAGFDLPHALVNLGRIRAADIIWSMTEKEAFAVAAVQSLGLAPRRPIITSTVWITNEWHRIPFFMRPLYRHLGRHFDYVTVQSKAALELAHVIFPASRIELMYFGINPETFTMAAPVLRPQPPVMRIFAAGNDRTRDWETFLRAFGNDPRFSLEIYCWWLPAKTAAAYTNLQVHRAMTMDELVAAIQAADIVAVPMTANTFSGITFAINSAAMGKTILSTRTGGVTTYFDEDELLYCAVGDPDDMRAVVAGSSAQSRFDLACRAHRRFLQRDYTSLGMIKRFAELTRQIVAPTTTAAAVP